MNKSLKMILLIVFSYLAHQSSAQSTIDINSQTLARIIEGTIDNAHGVTSTDCMLIFQDGNYHLEHRFQQLPNQTATLRVLDATLSTMQLEQLRELLGEENLNNLPPYIQPKYPINDLLKLTNFSLEFSRKAIPLRVGYLLWSKKTHSSTSNLENKDVQKGWEQSKTTLQPVVDWFHKIKQSNTTQSNGKSNLCGTADR